jgi:hypothetical protein
MAEIDIQPKKRPVWPWILGIIAAIIIIWIILRALDAQENKTGEIWQQGHFVFSPYLPGYCS